ncbi:probable serine/threonine-protein kinase drkD [Procambarus clarkii]|uniref:probable serine/threonine-protein kinase drkD n=1 Tax=Procambarus clarkii TaxID=6728 RepID=UPI00374251E5
MFAILLLICFSISSKTSDLINNSQMSSETLDSTWDINVTIYNIKAIMEQFDRAQDQLQQFDRAQDQLQQFDRAQDQLQQFDRAQDQLEQFDRAQDQLEQFDRAQDQLEQFDRAPDQLEQFDRAQDQLEQFDRAPDQLEQFDRAQDQLEQFDRAPDQLPQFDRAAVELLVKDRTRYVGSGTYGVVVIVGWQGSPAALKVAKSSSYAEFFIKEANVLELLNGAGGAPLLLGVTIKPPAILTSYKGNQTLETVLKIRQYNLIEVGLLVGRKLLEIHKLGIVHNDLKCDNVMVQGSPLEPEVSLIDFGLAGKNYENLFLSGDPDIYAPEILQDHRSTYASDVYSYGKLMLQILKASPAEDTLLEQVFQVATHDNPEKRPSLPHLLRRLQDHISKMSLVVKERSQKRSSRS